MSLVLALHFKNSIYEYFLPGINNRKVNVEVPTSITGYSYDFSLSLVVWNNIWQINGTDTISVFINKDRKTAVRLSKGLVLTCKHRQIRENFTIVVTENYDGYSGYTKYLIKPGRITIGSANNNIIQYDANNYVTNRHAILDFDQNGTCVITDRSKNGTYVNGKRMSGSHTLVFGDVIYIIGLKLVYLGDIIAVNCPSDQVTITGLVPFVPQEERYETEPAQATDEYYQRSPRQIEMLDNETIEIEAPPSPNRNRRQPLIFTIGPSMTMVLPMAAGVIFTTWSAQQSSSGTTSSFIYMGIVTSVTAAIIGIFWALSNYRYSKKTEREDEAKRSDLYRAYLENTRKFIVEKHSFNKTLLDRIYPVIEDCLSYAKTKNRRLWERNVNHLDFLTVRLGKGVMPSPNVIAVPKERFSLIDDSLAEEPQKIKKEYENLRNVPVCISLQEHKLIGIIGDGQRKCNQIAKLIAVQLATYHSSNDVKMAFIYDNKEAMDFESAKWLPHIWNSDGSLRMMASDANGVGEIFYDLSKVLRERLEERENSMDKSTPLPHYIVFISNPALVENEAMMKYLSSPTAQMGLTTVMIYGDIGRLPNSCTVIIQSDGDFDGYYSLDSSFRGYSNVVFDTIDKHQFEEFARELSGVHVRETQGAGSVPQLLTFLDMYETSDIRSINIEQRWLENRTYESMKAMIGYRGADTPLYLDIHEKYHGPHGLVAGTTGSGKSEMLQTYILSLALNYHPYEVSFILIDYKGGGMASSFEHLPHIAGIITNLGGNQTNRALASINSEIKRRQAIFNEYKLKHIDGYIELFRAGKVDMPIPHLLIIADEFAELKKEQPDFVRELVSASRVGRSLGVHLILATQKPSGVVDDEIWGNSKFRLCLRVQDKQDSNEMIKRPEAAYITNAGRGYFQVGSDEIFELFQSGWSGAEYEPEIPYSDTKKSDVRMINTLGRPIVVGSLKKIENQIEEEKKPTQLEVAVHYVADMANALGVKPLSHIWLPPLPRQLYLQDLASFLRTAYRNGAWLGGSCELRPLIGIVDDPVNQRQTELYIDILAEGHLIIVGSGASGKTTFLQTLLYSLVTTYSPKQVNIYIADFGSRTLDIFGALPHVGGVVYNNADDIDKVDKLISLLQNELSRRKIVFSEKGIGSINEYARLYDDVPFIIFAIDNFAAWNENCSRHEENLVQLTREAASYGIYLVLACTNASDVRSKIRQNINYGVGLQLADRYAYEEAIGPKTEIIAEDRTPGRGIVCFPNPLEFQTALCLEEKDPTALRARLLEQFNDMAGAWTGASAPAIPQVPSDMTFGSIIQSQEFKNALHSAHRIPFAYDLTEARIVSIDLTKTFCYSIGGAPRSGKTNLMKVLIRVAKEQGGRVYIFDNVTRELESCSQEIGADGYITSTDELFDFMQDIIIPEFTRRNKAKGEFVKGGRKNADEYVASEQKIFLFIADMTAFCETVYGSERDMSGFMELMVARGDNNMIYLFACVSQSDMTGEYNSKRFMRGFVAWKEGVHLGGKLDDQKIFDFDVPVLERGKKLPAGYGHTVIDGVTKRIVTPLEN